MRTTSSVSRRTTSYGAAGSILVLLLWVYYSGLIFYFGAEFTKVYADKYGSRTKARQQQNYSLHYKNKNLSPAHFTQ